MKEHGRTIWNLLHARLRESQMVVPILGVPYWGLYKQEILLFGVYIRVPYCRKPPNDPPVHHLLARDAPVLSGSCVGSEA